MSYNEIKKAKELQEYYYLYYVFLDGDDRSLFVLNNPYKALELEQIFNVVNTNKMVTMRIEEIQLQITDFKEFTPIHSFSKMKDKEK